MKQFLSRHLDGPGGITQLLVITLPMVVSQTCETIMLFTDRLFLSQISPIQMAAGMTGGLTAFVFVSFFFGVIRFATPLVAQYLGSGNEKKCAEVTTQALIFALATYPILLGTIPIGNWMFELLGDSREQAALSATYFNILIIGAIFPLATQSINCFFCGIGKTRIVMIASVVTMVVNVIVNYALVLGNFGFPSLGIKGAAIGSIIGNFCGLLVVVTGYFGYHHGHPRFMLKKSIRFNALVMKKLLRFGYPGGLEFFLNLLAFDLMVLLFHSYGPRVAAAVTIAFNWDLVCYFPMIGVNIGVTSLVGRFMGARDPDLAHRTLKSGLKITGIYAVIMLLMFSFLAQLLVSIFIADPESNPELSQLAVFMVRMIAFYVIADGLSVVYSGALRGAGDTFWTMILSVSIHWLFVIEAFVMVVWLELLPKIAWMGFVFTVPVITTAFFLRYRSGRWRTLAVVDAFDKKIVSLIDNERCD